MALARASLAYNAWSTEKGLNTFNIRIMLMIKNRPYKQVKHISYFELNRRSQATSSALASIFLWVKPCCSTWVGIPSNCTEKAKQTKTCNTKSPSGLRHKVAWRQMKGLNYLQIVRDSPLTPSASPGCCWERRILEHLLQTWYFPDGAH